MDIFLNKETKHDILKQN